MNTISNQKALKSRLSASWPHDSSHYRFHRIHNSRAPFELEPERMSIGEGFAWAGASVLIAVVLFVALAL